MTRICYEAGPSGPGGGFGASLYSPPMAGKKMSKIDELYTQMCVIDNDVYTKYHRQFRVLE
jgi:hypothetical protein